MPGRCGRALAAAALVATWGAAVPAFLPAADQVPVYQKALPDVVLRDPATGAEVHLPRLASRRPAILLITDGSTGASCSLAQVLAAYQEEFAPWFSWTGIVSGPCSPERMELMHRTSPVRFESCLHDPEGAVRGALGIASLPALVLANEDGYVHAVCQSGDGSADTGKIAGLLRGLAAGSRRTRGTVIDFRLPRVGGGFASFLDVAGRDLTLISFLHSGCEPCARELEVLDYLRDRHHDGASLVTVFLDEGRDSRILGYLEAAGVRPDAVLRDPEQRLAQRYRITAVPALLVVDSAGEIVYSRRGYREEERAALYREVSAAFGGLPAPAAATACPISRDARRLHADACDYLSEGRPEYALLNLERLREITPGFHSVHLLLAQAALATGRRDLALESYARYLAADPLAYDRAEVRERIAELLPP